jgi:hypothetical protein
LFLWASPIDCLTAIDWRKLSFAFMWAIFARASAPAP